MTVLPAAPSLVPLYPAAPSVRSALFLNHLFSMNRRHLTESYCPYSAMNLSPDPPIHPYLHFYAPALWRNNPELRFRTCPFLSPHRLFSYPFYYDFSLLNPVLTMMSHPIPHHPIFPHQHLLYLKLPRKPPPVSYSLYFQKSFTVFQIPWSRVHFLHTSTHRQV